MGQHLPRRNPGAGPWRDAYPGSGRPALSHSLPPQLPGHGAHWHIGQRHSPCAQNSRPHGHTWRRWSPHLTSSPQLCWGFRWKPESWWIWGHSCWLRCSSGSSRTCWPPEKESHCEARIWVGFMGCSWPITWLVLCMALFLPTHMPLSHPASPPVLVSLAGDLIQVLYLCSIIWCWCDEQNRAILHGRKCSQRSQCQWITGQEFEPCLLDSILF